MGGCGNGWAAAGGGNGWAAAGGGDGRAAAAGGVGAGVCFGRATGFCRGRLGRGSDLDGVSRGAPTTLSGMT